MDKQAYALVASLEEVIHPELIEGSSSEDDVPLSNLAISIEMGYMSLLRIKM